MKFSTGLFTALLLSGALTLPAYAQDPAADAAAPEAAPAESAPEATDPGTDSASSAAPDESAAAAPEAAPAEPASEPAAEEAAATDDGSGEEGSDSEGGMLSSAADAVGGVFSGIGSLFETPQPWEGRPVYFSGMGGFFLTDKDRGAKNGYGATLAIGKRLTDGLALEIYGSSYAAGTEDGIQDNGDLRANNFGIGALVFPFSSSPGLYVLLGVGPGSGKGSPGAIANYKSTVFDSGLGWLYPLNNNLLLRAEARYHMDAHNRNQAGDQTPPKNNEDFYDGVFNIGVVMKLGEVAAPAEAPVEAAAGGPLDSDNDGVPDDQDKCPGTPAGAVVNAEGCEADGDGDGVPDREDKCPDTQAGTKVGPNGCPDDADGDGVPDAIDECPRTPAGAKVLANGCALQGDCRTPRAGEQVDANGCAVDKTFILKGVNFEFDSDRLTDPAKEILNQVGETLQAYADVDVEIAGHTDSSGTDSYNLGLSERRSIAVKQYLVGRGVEATRMSPVGYGEAQPIESNDNEPGRAANRRVELRVKDAGEGVSTPTPSEPAAPAEPAAAAPAETEPAVDAPAAEGEAAPAQ